MHALVGVERAASSSAKCGSILQTQHHDGSGHRAAHIACAARPCPKGLANPECQVLLKIVASGEAGQDGLRAGVALFVKGNSLINLRVRHVSFSHPLVWMFIHRKIPALCHGYRLGTVLHIKLGVDVADVSFHGGNRYE